jgi:hypothetical protein
MGRGWGILVHNLRQTARTQAARQAARVRRSLKALLEELSGSFAHGYGHFAPKSSTTVLPLRNDLLNTARRTLIEEPMGCKDDQATLQDA